ncbi:MAG TPA: Zn-dependent hydrolase [Gaiellales bacterium]|nr:Zn-dependent hydrolase [Gaiellales bacterium]
MTRSSRVEGRLDALYAIGRGEGANRPALSEHEDAAHALVEAWMREAGLEIGKDTIGNLYGRLRGREPQLAEIWCGSHLDSVPRGGRFDGALGVVAALEAVSRLEPETRTVTVVAFRDEEGWRFGDGFLGSRAVSGQLDAAGLENTDRDGVTVREALAQGGHPFAPGQGWLAPAPGAFLEAHIEQGPVLAGRDAALGVVTSIVGILELRVVFTGAAGHAGTTPMGSRRDAALCAAAFQVGAATAAREIADAVLTVGSPVAVEPGAANVIARRTTVRVDARAPDAKRLAALEQAVWRAADDAARAHGCEAEVDVTMRIDPVACDPSLCAVLERAAARAPSLPSGAGHDAQVLARAGIPVAMLFVRSLNGGISHSPAESTSPDDVAACVDALEAALGELARRR